MLYSLLIRNSVSLAKNYLPGFDCALILILFSYMSPQIWLLTNLFETFTFAILI